MSLVINTNVSSLNAQNNLTKSQSALATATQRLSSGLKINSAADNAAGYAISQRYTTQIGGLTQASANASDAINLAQTAGSALDQVTANLQAIRDLATQAANGTYTDDDRTSLNQEVQQRLAEITRIANQTTFNGKKVLDGSLKNTSFQVGANVGQTISVDLGTDVRANSMGSVAALSSDGTDIFAATGSGTPGTSGTAVGSTSAALTYATGSNDLTVDGYNITLDTTAYGDADDLASDIQSKLNTAADGAATYTVSNDAGVLTIKNDAAGSTAPAISGGAATAAFGTPGTTDGTAGSGGAVDLSGEGLTINNTAIDLSGAKSWQDVADAINNNTALGGTVSAAVTVDSSGASHLSLYSSADISVEDTGDKLFTAGTATAAASKTLAQGDVSTVDDANSLIVSVDAALKTVSDFAAQLGAVQNRFQSTIATVAAQTTNLQASQSTIQDADFAAETAALSKAQVLQQAGISVLAQANSNPQQVLKLLQ